MSLFRYKTVKFKLSHDWEWISTKAEDPRKYHQSSLFTQQRHLSTVYGLKLLCPSQIKHHDEQEQAKAHHGS